MIRSSRQASRLLLPFLVLLSPLCGCQTAHKAVTHKEQVLSNDKPETMSLSQIEPQPILPPPSRTSETPPPNIDELLSSIRQSVIDKKAGLAIQRLEATLIDYPDWPQGYRLLATLYWREGDELSASDRARQVLERNGRDGFSHYILGMRATALGDYEKALLSFRLSLECPDTLESPEREIVTRYRLALRLMADGYLTASLEQYKYVEQAFANLNAETISDRELTLIFNGTGGTVATQIAELCEKLERYDEAAAALDTMVRIGVADQETLHRYIRCLAMSGQVDEAVEALQQFEHDTPTLVDLLIEIRTRSNQSDQLVQDLLILHDQRREDPFLLQTLVDHLIHAKRAAEAEELLTRNFLTPPCQFEPLFSFVLEHESAINATCLLIIYIQSVNEQQATSTSPAVSRCSRIKQSFQANPDTMRSCIATLAHNKPLAKRIIQSQPPGAINCHEIAESFGCPETVLQTESAWNYLRGCLAHETGNSEQATAFLSQVLKVEPAWSAPRVELAEIQMDQHKWQEAVHTLMPVSGTPDETNSLISLSLANAYAGLDQLPQAISWYTNAAQKNPMSTRALISLGDLYRRTSKPVDAFMQYSAAYDRNPYDDEALERVIVSAYELGRLQTVKNRMVQLQLRSTSRQRYARCQARVDLNPRDMDFNQFRKTLLDSIGDAPAEPDTLYLIAYSFFEQQNYDAAREYALRAIQADPDHFEANDLALWIDRYTLRYEEALAHAESLRDRFPNRDAWRGHQLDILNILQRHEERIAILEPLIEDPNLSDLERDQYRAVLAGVLQMAGREEEGIAILRSFCESEPENNGHRKRLIEYLIYTERYEEAAQEAKQWYLDSGERFGRLQWITALGKLEQYNQAYRILLDRLKDNPQDDDARLQMIGILTLAGRYDDAIELAESNLSHGRYRRQYEEAIWQALDADGRHNEAAQRIQQWIYRNNMTGREFSPDDLVMLRAGFLADQLIKDKQFGYAGRLLRRWIEDASDPRVTAMYLRRLSESDRLQGDLETALGSLERAYELYPTDTVGMNALGYSLADTGKDLDRAESLVRQAVAMEPLNPAFLDSLGWILYKRGNFEEALTWLKRAVGASHTTDPEILDHLGDTYWRLGNRSEAISQWKQALGDRDNRILADLDIDLQNRLKQLAEKLKAVENEALPPVAPLVLPEGEQQNN